MKACYPQATVEIMSPGHTSNIIVYVDGQEIWNKKKGDGVVIDKNIGSLVNRVKAIVEAQ
jgi:hypothetical protein